MITGCTWTFMKHQYSALIYGWYNNRIMHEIWPPVYHYGTTQKMKFLRSFFYGTADMAIFTDETVNGKLHFLCSVALL